MGEGVGEGVGLGDGEGVGEGDGDGLGDGGVGEPCTITWTDAVVVDVPASATRLKVVVALGCTCRDPLAGTVPTPLSMTTVAAPWTSQLSVAEEPGTIVTGEAENCWIESPLASELVSLSTRPQPRLARARSRIHSHGGGRK